VNHFKETQSKLKKLKKGASANFDRPVTIKTKGDLKVEEEQAEREAILRSFDKYRDESGKIKAKEYLEDNLEFILMDLMNPGRGIPTRKSENILKILDILKDKQEVEHRVEFTVADRQALYTELLECGRREAEESGVCPMCHQRKALRTELRLDTRPEQPEDNPVEALDIPF